MIIRELLTKWKIDVNDKDIASANKKLTATKKRLDDIAAKAGKVGGKLTAFVTAPILGIGVAFIKAASDSEETFSKFDTIFKSMKGIANDTAKSFAKDFGLSSTAARQLLGDTGDLLTGLNFTQKEALELSKATNELAVDLASFANFAGGAEGASNALTKALLGEREGVKALGIAIGEEDVKAKIKSLKASGKLIDASERQAKAFATLALAQEQSKNAIGDFARTSQGFANRLRTMQARISDMAVSFGKIMLPAALKVLNVFIEFIEFMSELSEGTKKFIIVLAGLAAVIGPIILLIGGFAAAAAALTVIMETLGIVSFAALLPILLKFILIGIAIAAVLLIAEDLFAFFRGDISLVGRMLDKFTKKFLVLPKAVKGALILIKAGFRLLIKDFLLGIDSLEIKFQKLMTFLGSVGKFIGSIFSSVVSNSLLAKLAGTLSSGEEGLFGAAGATADIRAGLASAPASSQTSSTVINMNSPITVPPGTPPELVPDAIERGVAKVLGGILRNTKASGGASISF